MSGRRISWLAGFLVLQLLVAAALLIARGGFREPETGALLAFDAGSIDHILIDEGADKSIGLERRGDGWVLVPAADGAQDAGPPADASKVQTLLDKLAGLKAPWPVATTASARERFEVTDAKHQRRVRLQSGERSVVELLLGTSPGFRRLHARIVGQDDVYEVDLSHFELSTTADEWIDRALLAAQGEVTVIEREGHWRLARSDDGWMLADGAADSAAAEQMAERFANLRVLGLAPAPQDDAPAEPAATFVITDGKGQHRLSLYGAPQAAEYVISSDRQAGRFRLATFLAEQLLAEPDTLLPKAAGASTAEAGAEAAPPEESARGALPNPGAAPAPAANAPSSKRD